MKRKPDTFGANIPKIEKTIGYTFRDKSLLTQAFTRTSYCNEHKGDGGVALQSNEVLEFFGDGVLSVAIISLLLKDHTDRYEYGIRTKLNEGDFSNIKSKLSDKKNLSETTLSLGLEKYLRIGEGDQKLGISREPSVMEDLFESIIGAVYIDSGMDIGKVTEVVAKILDTGAYAFASPPIQSAKNALQEWCADKKRRLPPPVYRTLSEDGPDHKKVYERGCYIGDRLVASGKGKNQKLADAAAAEAALTVLKAESRPSVQNRAPAESRAEKSESEASEKTAAKVGRKEKRQTKVDSKAAKDIPKARTNAKKSAELRSKAAEPAKPAPSVKKLTRPPLSGSTALLKEYALSHKAATPAFKDLGESVTKGVAQYRIECRFMGVSAIGTSDTRLGARESAAGMIAKELKLGSRKKSVTHKRRPEIKRK